MKKIVVFLVLFGLTVLLSRPCAADEGKKANGQKSKASQTEEAKKGSLEAIEILTGFSWGNLVNGQENYNFIPVSVSFDFNLRELTKKIHFNPKQLLQFQIEPFLGFISSPDSNFEGGTNFWIKMGIFPDTWKCQPYAKIGVGLDYMTLHTQEQSTQFNFTEQVGLGLHYYFTKNTALTIEGRMRHLSNASIKQPNHGINSYFGLAGISYRF